MEQKNAVKNLYRDVVEKIYGNESSKNYIYTLLVWKRRNFIERKQNQHEK